MTAIGPIGVFKCSACNFTQMFSTMRASDGAIGENCGPYDPDRLVCPNDDTLLHAVTWQESEVDAWKVAETHIAENTRLTEQLARLTAEVNEALTIAEGPSTVLDLARSAVASNMELARAKGLFEAAREWEQWRGREPAQTDHQAHQFAYQAAFARLSQAALSFAQSREVE